MKILFLTYPYLGAEYLAEELANASTHNFIPDPMNLNWYGAKTIINKADGDGNIIQEEVTYPRKYIFPDAIPENTVVTHNVCWHTLPNNLTETQFLEQFIPKSVILVIRIVIITCTNRKFVLLQNMEGVAQKLSSSHPS